MQYRRLWAVAVFGVSSVINPGYFAGCASGDDGNAVMAAELAEVVVAASDSYDVTLGGAAYRLDVDVEPVREGSEQARRRVSAFAQAAHACGRHKLVATAQACVDTYEMDVTGHVTLLRALGGDAYEEVASEVAVTGSLSALSTSFATLSLQFSGGQLALLRDAESFMLGEHNLRALLTEHSP